MGLLSWLFGWGKFKAANNVILANHLVQNSDPSVVAKLTAHAVEISLRNRYKRDDLVYQSVLSQLNGYNRVKQLTMIAWAAHELGHEPLIKNEFWNLSKQPLVAANTVTEDMIEACCVITERNSGQKIHWPGNEVRIVFSKS